MVAERESADSVRRADRLPPHSEEAERGILGAILLDAERVLDLCVERGLRADAFHLPAHRTLYQACLDLSQGGSAVDAITVSEHLRRKGQLDAVGGALEVDRLIDATPTTAHADFYADIVRQKYLLRRIIACARDAESLCHGPEDAADDVLNRVEASFLAITEDQRNPVATWFETVNQVMSQVEHIFQHKRGMVGVSTGYLNLDEKLLGMKPGELIVLAARPSMGKTSLAMNIAENVAMGKRSEDGPHAVGVFSLEMSQESLVLRMLCSHAAVNAFDMTRGFLSAADHGKLTQAASALRKAPIFLDDTGGLHVHELRARARRMRVKQGVDLIVVDYLQLLQFPEHMRNGVQAATAAISGQLKAMAKELRVPVLVLSQLSRAPETRDKQGKPKLSDLRDSGAIEQDADVVMLLRRPCKYPDDPASNDRSLAMVDVAKQRNGPTGEVEMNFIEECTRFQDRARGVDGAAGVGAHEVDEVDVR